MKPKIKAKWVAALRSGKYKQGMLKLKKLAPDGTCQYCCLGVLCDIYTKSRRTRKIKFIKDSKHFAEVFVTPHGSSSSGLTQDVIKWAGVDNKQTVEIDGQKNHLIVHNDNGVPFEKIASAIEAQL